MHAIDGLVTVYVKIIREEVSFAAMHQTYVAIYREAFPQQEIDGILAFYGTPAGRALIDKTPFVMQRTMELMQARIGPIVQKFQESVRKASAEFKAAGDNPATDEKPAAEDAPK